jgi:hypothetical protein
LLKVHHRLAILRLPVSGSGRSFRFPLPRFDRRFGLLQKVGGQKDEPHSGVKIRHLSARHLSVSA